MIMIRAWKIVTKFHNYSYEIIMSPVIVNSNFECPQQLPNS